MKRVLFISTVLLLSIFSPALALAKEYNGNKTVSYLKEIVHFMADSNIMYAISDGVNIREEPNMNSAILGHTKRNTSFEVILEYGGWSKVTTENGYAYIKSEYLSTELTTYTEEDFYILAHVLSGECQTYPDEEQLCVGSVVLNRVSSDEFPNTVEEVVFQRGQYACTWDGNYYREPTEDNWKNAKWLLEHGSVLPDYVIYQSGGKQGKHVYMKTKWHYYCY